MTWSTKPLCFHLLSKTCFLHILSSDISSPHIFSVCFWYQKGGKKNVLFQIWNLAYLPEECLKSSLLLYFKKRILQQQRVRLLSADVANMEAAVTRRWEGGMLVPIALFSSPVDHDSLSSKWGEKTVNSVTHASVCFQPCSPSLKSSNIAWVHCLVL